jgi:glycosyltransferase involved in cell wall biosynthesis
VTTASIEAGTGARAHGRVADRPRLPLTCIVLAQNSAQILPRCLRSLSFAADVLVVDGGSHDDTVAVATSLGARVVSNPWPGFAAQRRFALQHARHGWILASRATRTRK